MARVVHDALDCVAHRQDKPLSTLGGDRMTARDSVAAGTTGRTIAKAGVVAQRMATSPESILTFCFNWGLG